MSNISPVLQQRVRRLLQLTGGAEIEPIEAIQPVVVISSFAEGRQPQTEQGDTLIRSFQGGRSCAAGGAGTYSLLALRVGDPNTLVWIKRITIINETAAAVPYSIGRAANQTAIAWATAAFSDMRLPLVDLGASSFEIFTAVPVGFPITYGRLAVSVPANNMIRLDVDYICRGPDLAGTPYPENLVVTQNAANAGTGWITFEGVMFTVLDRDRP